jgi:hypothetical protein
MRTLPIIFVAALIVTSPSAAWAGGKGGGGSTSTGVTHQDFQFQKLHDTASVLLSSARTAPRGPVTGHTSGKRQHAQPIY